MRTRARDRRCERPCDRPWRSADEAQARANPTPSCVDERGQTAPTHSPPPPRKPPLLRSSDTSRKSQSVRAADRRRQERPRARAGVRDVRASAPHRQRVACPYPLLRALWATCEQTRCFAAARRIERRAVGRGRAARRTPERVGTPRIQRSQQPADCARLHASQHAADESLRRFDAIGGGRWNDSDSAWS